MGMIYRRWLFSSFVLTCTVCVLVAMYGIRRGLPDLAYTWLAVLAVNNFRIALGR